MTFYIKMEDNTYHAINLLIDVAVSGNMDALDYLLESIAIYFEDGQFIYIMQEVAGYIKIHHPEVQEWLQIELLGEEPFNLDSSIESGTILDIKHILLDEGYIEGKDFIIRGAKLHLSAQVIQCLDHYYNIEPWADSIEIL